MIRAVIYIPPYDDLDGYFATKCQRYAERRGYRAPALIARSWDTVERLLLNGWAQVAIVARYEHREGARLIEPEVVEQEELATVVILDRRRSQPGRHRAPEAAGWCPNERPSLAERIIDDAMRRWRFGVSAIHVTPDRRNR
jgi:hypothetical protein